MITLRPRAVRLTRPTRRPSPLSALKAHLLRLELDPLRLSLAGLMLLTIGGLHLYFVFLKPLRPALTLALFAAVYAYLHPHRLSDGRGLRMWPAKVVGALVLIACIGVPFGLSIGQSATYLLDEYSKVLLFWLLLTIGIRHERDLAFLVWGYVLSAAFLCWLSIFVVGVTEQSGTYTHRLNDEALGMYDPNDMGVLLTVAVPLVLLCTRASGWKGKLFAMVMLVAVGWTIALSGSRGAFVGLIIVFAILLFALREVSVVKRLGVVVMIAGALVFAAPQGYWKQMGTMLNPEADYNWSDQDGRRQVWARGVGYMLRYPVFGVGIDNFGRAEGTISEKAKTREDGMGIAFIAAHNSFVQVGAELGVFGLILWTSLSVGGIIGMVRLRRRLPKHWATGAAEERFLHAATLYLPIALIGFIVTSFFVSFAFMDPIYILVAFVTAVYACAERRLAPTAVATATDRRRRYIPVRSPWLAKP